MPERAPQRTGHPLEARAFQDYCALGPSRSLPKLRAFYLEQGFKPPHLTTLKKWCKADNWVERAREQDRQAQAAAAARQTEERAEEIWQASEALRKAARKGLEAFERALDDIVKNGAKEGDLKVLGEIVPKFLQVARELEGHGPTSGTQGTLLDDDGSVRREALGMLSEVRAYIAVASKRAEGRGE